MQPQFEDETPVNPFDFWAGANFKLKARNVEGYRNYDKSEFESSSVLAEDSKMESIWNNEHSLSEFLDPKNFKSYDELKKKLEMVLVSTGQVNHSAAEVSLDDKTDTIPFDKPTIKVSKPKVDIDLDDDDSSLSYFAKLANDD
jgi:uncharacterized protein